MCPSNTTAKFCYSRTKINYQQTNNESSVTAGSEQFICLTIRPPLFPSSSLLHANQNLGSRKHVLFLFARHRKFRLVKCPMKLQPDRKLDTSRFVSASLTSHRGIPMLSVLSSIAHNKSERDMTECRVLCVV
jgi:hypothetical protein